MVPLRLDKFFFRKVLAVTITISIPIALCMVNINNRQFFRNLLGRYYPIYIILSIIFLATFIAILNQESKKRGDLLKDVKSLILGKTPDCSIRFTNTIKELQRLGVKKIDLSNATLKKVQLSSKDLRMFNFSGANLTHANFKQADLRGVSFEKAKLKGANFAVANLQGANLSNTSLKGVYLPEPSSLEGANLMDTNLKGAYASDTDWIKELSDLKLPPTGVAYIQATFKVSEKINSKEPNGYKILRISKSRKVIKANKTKPAEKGILQDSNNVKKWKYITKIKNYIIKIIKKT